MRLRLSELETSTLGPALVAGLYGVVAAAWIVTSDLAAWVGATSEADIATAQLVKGLAFVVVTTGGLYLLTRQLVGANIRELARFRAFAAAASDWLWETDQDHRMVYLSPAREQLVGEPNAEVLGRTRWDYAGADRNDPAWRDHISALERHEPFRDFVYEVEIAGQGGRILRTSGTPFFDGKGRFLGYRGVARDITADREVQETLHGFERDLADSRRRLAALLDALPAEIALVDGNGRIAEVNEGWRRAVEAEGRAGPDRGVGRPYTEVCRVASTDSDAGGAVRAALDRILANDPIAEDLEYVDETASGRRWFRMAVVPLSHEDLDGAVVAHFEVTDRKEAELRLAEREERFRILSDLASDVAFAYSVEADGTLRRKWVFGSGMREWSGLLPKSISLADGLPPLAKLTDDDRRRRLRRLLAGNPVSDDLRVPRDDSGELWIHFAAWPRTDDAESQVLEIVGSMKDVTDLKVMEEELAQAQKMEAVGQLTGGIAHDFNNLLTVVLGNAEEIVLAGDRIDPSIGEAASMIEQAGRRGVELTRQLLAFSRRQPLVPQRVDLTQMLETQRTLLDRTLGETVTVDIMTPDGLWPVLADPTQLETALLNVAVNARDAMPDGGTLTIRAENLGADDAPAGLAPGEYACISVTDTGVGVPVDLLDRVFEPFFTTKEVGKGTGLGLSMVYGFARQSGGMATVESRPGEGTTVRLYLPRHGEATETEEMDRPRSREMRTGEETVLVVEDQPLVLDSVAKMVSRLGYTVVTASNASEALTAVDTRPEIALVFSDILMPGDMSGVDLIRAARDRRPELKALLTTGYSQRHARDGTQPEAGVLYKPYRLSELAEALRRALDE